MTKVFVICMFFLCMGLLEVSAAGSFKDNGNGTVTDSETHLMWQQGAGDDMKWKAAIAYCSKLFLAGQNDWRVPNSWELESIIDHADHGSDDWKIDKTYFEVPRSFTAGYWTSDTSDSFPTQAWFVNFSTGKSNVYPKTGSLYVRCVRRSK